MSVNPPPKPLKLFVDVHIKNVYKDDTTYFRVISSYLKVERTGFQSGAICLLRTVAFNGTWDFSDLTANHFFCQI